MYVQYGLADEEMGRGYLYNTARKMGAREKANQAKFDPRFDELNRRANFRLAVLPDGKMVIRDVVHTDDDTLTRVIDQNDTTIVNSAGDRFNNNSFRTRLARKIFGSSAYDQANKNFEMIDFQKTGGIVKAQEGNKMTVDDIHNINKSMYNHMSYSNPKGFWEFTKSDYGDRYHHQNIMDGKKVGFHTFVYDEPNPILNSFY